MINERNLWRGKCLFATQDETQNADAWLSYGVAGDWVYGVLCEHFNNVTTWNSIYNLNDNLEIPIIKMTACQCIGKTDVNDKLIYDGDIVEAVYAGKKRLGYIKYSIDELAFEVVFEKFPVPIRWIDNMEVVGNIYDNAELLSDFFKAETTKNCFQCAKKSAYILPDAFICTENASPLCGCQITCEETDEFGCRFWTKSANISSR